MSQWHLHALDARGDLGPHLDALRIVSTEAVTLAQGVAALPRFDLVVHGRAGGGVPEWGVGGLAPRPGLIEITVDPERWRPEGLRRTLIHELHHLLRWDGPGYGRTLGQSLVSEGLAGHFVLQVLGGRPDPWDRVIPAPGLAGQALREWDVARYDHARWFFGGGGLVRWAGYGLGHRLVGHHLSRHAGATAAGLAGADARRFRPDLTVLAASAVAAPV